MKILNTAPITNSSQFPVKKGTLAFLQLAYQEAIAAQMVSLIGPTYNPATVYVMFGVVNSGTAPSYSITAGAAFYNGEVFYIDAAAFTASGSNVAVFSIAQTQYTTDADPVTFSDAVVRNVHDIRKLVISQGASGSGIADYSALYRLSFYIPLQLNMTAPVTPPYDDNVLQLIGSYPNYYLYVPAPNNNHEILTAGSFNVGDVPGIGGFDQTVTFGTPLTTADYYVVGTLVSNGTPEADSVVFWTIRNRLTTGFQVHFREFTNSTENIAFEYIVFKK